MTDRMDGPVQIDWRRVPDRFHYFRDAVEACGETRIVKYNEELGRHVRFVENVTDAQLAQLRAVYERLLSQNDLNALWDWLERIKSDSESEIGAAWHVQGILMVLSDMAERGIEPFSRQQISPCRPKPLREGIGVLAHLPDHLAYLIAPALKYGRYHFDDEIFQFLENATESEMDELAAVAERVLINGHYAEVNRFLDGHSMTEYPEAADLYFLFGVLDYADLQFDRAPEA
jgi:hypothetical protein